MERYYIFGTAFLSWIVCVIAIIYFGSWFIQYIERTRKENPAKANLVQLLGCILGIFGLAVIKIFVPNDNMSSGALGDVSTAGIVFLSLFSFVFGALYVARKISK
jgi:hypothetical protein